MKRPTTIWITWEHQRRSIVLAKEFGTIYYELLSKRNPLIRYISLSLKSFSILLKTKPALLFIQNPSIILTCLACFFKIFFNRTVLVVDRHSNFFPIAKFTIINWLLDEISKFTLRNTDLTLVTNDYLKKLVESCGGNAIVLEDKIPEFKKNKDLKLQGRHNLLYVCSFDIDEPYEEVIKAAQKVTDDTYIYITGDFHKIKDPRVVATAPHNLVFLGYLPDDDYIDYLHAVDAVIVLTTWEHTLLCGAYEAVAIRKPLILSNKRDLVTYFNKGVILTENDADSLADSIHRITQNKTTLENNIRMLKIELNDDWQLKFTKVQETIHTLISYKTRKAV